MNSNGPNLLTPISGITWSADSLKPLLTADAAPMAGDFAQALIAELGYQQPAAVQTQLPLPFQSLDQLSDASLQDIAALLGNKLPMASKMDVDIDLEQTLASLKQVLQHIDAATGAAPFAGPLSSSDQEFQEYQDDLDGEDVENLLQWLSESLDTRLVPETPVIPVHTVAPASLPGPAENRDESGRYQELGTVLAADVGTQADDAADAVDATEIAVDAIQKKTDLFEQSTVEWTGDQHALEMAPEMVSSSKRIGIEPKLELPAMTRQVTHPEWQQELGERVLWMNHKTMPSAELRLNPQHLGPVSIRIKLDQDQASIAFSAQHASVREAIEAAVPKLREMLGTQQLNLADVNVSQPPAFDQGKSPGYGQMAQQQGQGRQYEGENVDGFDHNGQLADRAEDAESLKARVSNGLLSFFA
ncbi:MAG: flagellar hook-length control protein FliK [Gammaproteobacteria bacterium]